MNGDGGSQSEKVEERLCPSVSNELPWMPMNVPFKRFRKHVAKRLNWSEVILDGRVLVLGQRTDYIALAAAFRAERKIFR